MGNTEARKAKALNTLISKRIMPLADLADLLKVSNITARRYVLELSKLAPIQILGGTVIYNDNLHIYDTRLENTKRVTEKISIAKQAIKLINNRDFVFLDGGSTISKMAEMLNGDLSAIYLSRSLNVANPLFNLTLANNNIKLLLAGGKLNNKTLSFYGNKTLEFLRQYRPNISFFGTGGADIKHGVTCVYTEDATTRQLVMKNSLKKVLLLESAKFGLVSSVHYADMTDFDIIVTNKNAPTHIKEYLASLDIKVIYS